MVHNGPLFRKFYLKFLQPPSQGDGFWEKEHIATINNNNYYSETNVQLMAPTAYHGVMGSFEIKKLAFVKIKASIITRGAVIKLTLSNGNTILMTQRYSGAYYQYEDNHISILNPGKYSIYLYMDADSDIGGSYLKSQIYEIDAIYPKFSF